MAQKIACSNCTVPNDICDQWRDCPRKAAEAIAPYIEVEKFTPADKQSTPCDHEFVERYVCSRCGGVVTAKFD
jgi:hypothetical protein